MSGEKTLLTSFLLRDALWDSRADAWAALIPRDNPAGYPGHLQNLINSGEAELFHIVTPASESAAGFVVVAVEGEDYVVHAAYGIAGNDLTEKFLPLFEAQAKERKCVCVRWHTMRPGLIKKSLNLGFEISEVVLRKKI
jgi:hypothetical protein